MAVEALEIDSVQRSQVLFVGDSLRCDILGAKAAGLSTAWINPSGTAHPAADIVVPGLIELEQLLISNPRRST
ncbi:HAD family hydrolase [Gloeobacter violaceus]|uniref:Gsr2938 protein n=1 Tax=Gloeobacter violaceus (strain ATCC 29082 / PCC 7421) TaxID=251221 RepID=Q7NCP0_GLOVI|nr:gsr2938 [Gloeobacter violaceus PCC 7421]